MAPPIITTGDGKAILAFSLVNMGDLFQLLPLVTDK